MRCYEELNNYLAPKRQRQSFVYEYAGEPTLQAVLKDLGIPPGEVSLVLANGISVSLNYTLQPGERIAIYPVFERFDISSVTKVEQGAVRHTRFIASQHLGRLAVKLRLLGFDTVYRNDFSTKDLLELSAKEQRIILTRGKSLLKRRDVTPAFLIKSERLGEQLAEVLIGLDLFLQLRPFSRCLSCNGEIVVIAKDQILNVVPASIRESQAEFFKCGCCGKIYWKGSHYENMTQEVGRLSRLRDKATRSETDSSAR